MNVFQKGVSLVGLCVLLLMGATVIAQEEFYFKGLLNTVFEARPIVREDRLFVMPVEPDSEPWYGTSIALGEAEFALIGFETPPPAELPRGARLRFSPTGELGGEPGVPLPQFDVVPGEDQFSIFLDPGPMNPQSLRVEARRGGVTVQLVPFDPCALIIPCGPFVEFVPEAC